MKKILLVLALAISTLTFAQKDELKTLKKIYSKNTISEKDLIEYKAASDALSSIAKEESDVVYAKFYKTMYPTVVLASKGDKATIQDQLQMYNPEFVIEYGNVIRETKDFEIKSGKKIYYDDLIQEEQMFKASLQSFANNAYNASKFKEASSLFYMLYLFDKENEGQQLDNASVSAVQAQDYKLAEKMYDEYKNSDYLNKGIIYYAKNKANDNEETFPNRDARVKAIAMGTHEKPRDEKVSLKKPEVYKMLALVSSHNGNMNKAKKNIEEALALNPNDADLKKEAFRIYFNEGYDMLKDDQKLVDEINANRDNKAKFDELMAERKEIFKKALPNFEKAYSINSADENTKALLKMSYEMLGMNDKASTIK
ncbi:hypothetical protein [Flavobacterium okayamense]|uniref:Tetratricopeptide repeat-containing protein n=1 Tax=Flavobacterium okayamense TaxID=2830782 RepID=A0ABM7S8S7_9FLAO|nr:hypothetical protein [Flavobacterium okayamense]BCY29181.1 hypothetical protein KK2020170_20490 [Flavobacterium okayamense]